MAQPRLKQYFPMIRTREQVLDDIQSNILLNTKFRSLSEERQTEFIDICTGERGVKILYNSYFKTVMDPKKYPERVKSLLECILVKEIVSYEVLESSSFSLGDEKSLVIMDIVVEHIDGTIINLEIQKIGYDFPSERAACYASDLTIRQYVHAKNFAAELPPENPGHRFSYRSIRPVYTIVLIEQSTAIFSKFPDTYIHRFSQMSDSGLSMNLLHHYIFIPLDIFKKTHQNGDVSTKLDAWLMFLSTDEPNKIMRLVDKFPEFLALYRHIYEICANTEDIMGIFSEALAEMDRNTARMISFRARMISFRARMISFRARMISFRARMISSSKKRTRSSNKMISSKSKTSCLNKSCTNFRISPPAIHNKSHPYTKTIINCPKAGLLHLRQPRFFMAPAWSRIRDGSFRVRILTQKEPSPLHHPINKIPRKNAPWAIPLINCSTQFAFTSLLSRHRANAVISTIPAIPATKHIIDGNLTHALMISSKLIRSAFAISEQIISRNPSGIRSRI